MKTKKFLLVIPIAIIVLSLIPTVNCPIITAGIDETDSFTPIKAATESGGGYIMDTNAAYSWIEISGTGTWMAISNSDDNAETISFLGAGWNFTFYEINYSSITVSSNGWMSFPDLGDTGDWIDDIPGASAENIDAVALLEDDLDPGSRGDIYYEFRGSAPNRYLVIQYDDVGSCCSGDYVGTFEVIFYENGDIKFQYQDVSDEPYPDIGLDHGDLVNYNRWETSTPFSSKAISFTFDKMIITEYGLEFDVDDEFTWLVRRVNDSIMEQAFGATWEADFGLFPDMLVNEKTKINMTSILDNSTHWEINYTTWDWIDRGDNFTLASDGTDSILYRQEPLNYTTSHMLPNTFPLFLPNYTSLYLMRANLDPFYDDIDFFEDGSVELESWLNIGLNEYVDVEARYNSLGILEELEVEYEYENGYEWYDTVFHMIRIYEGPKPSYICVNESDIYQWGIFTSVENAPPGYDEDMFDYIPERMKIIVEFIGGEDPQLNRTLLVLSMSARLDGVWSTPMDMTIYLYKNFEDNPNLIIYGPALIVETTINWGIMANIIEAETGEDVKALPNGFELETSYGPTLTIKQTYTSCGILDTASQSYNDWEFYVFRLNDFDYKIEEPPEEEDATLGIPGASLMIISLILLVGIPGLVWQLKKKLK